MLLRKHPNYIPAGLPVTVDPSVLFKQHSKGLNGRDSLKKHLEKRPDRDTLVERMID